MKKIRKFEIVTVTMVLFVSIFVLNSVYAQDSTTVSDTTRLKTEMEISESVRDVAETVDQIRVEVEKTEEEIKDTVKNGIDKNIINIRQNIDIQAYELQKAVDQDRLELFESLDSTLKNVSFETVETLSDFSEKVDQKIQSIQNSLETKSGIESSFEEERRTIKNTILRLQEIINEKKEIIENREGDKIYKDSDGDGVSDYDEEYIYGTDPENASTLGDGQSDGEKISSGRNPKTGEAIKYVDIRDDKESYVTSAYKLDNVALIKQEERDLIKFEGRAIPNSFVTLYIYSTPIIVTVKTDSNGDWAYELDKELEDGEHQLYVATVNNSGKIIAKSNPIAFTKTAEAASVGIIGVEIETSSTGDFFRDNFVLISLGILIVIVVLALMIIGRNKGVKDVVAELKNEVNDNQNQTPKV